jgi:hypothetical protein
MTCTTCLSRVPYVLCTRMQIDAVSDLVRAVYRMCA